MTKFYDLLDGYGYHLCDKHAQEEHLNTRLGQASTQACHLCPTNKESK